VVVLDEERSSKREILGSEEGGTALFFGLKEKKDSLGKDLRLGKKIAGEGK